MFLPTSFTCKHQFVGLNLMIYSTFSASMLKFQLFLSKCLPKKWRWAKTYPRPPSMHLAPAPTPLIYIILVCVWGTLLNYKKQTYEIEIRSLNIDSIVYSEKVTYDNPFP
jgi:hypothetical protein